MTATPRPGRVLPVAMLALRLLAPLALLGSATRAAAEHVPLQVPVLPPAAAHSIHPTSGTVGVDATVEVGGTGFTEEFGAGTLMCRLTYENGTVVHVCATRLLGDCVPTAQDQLTCETTRLRCELPRSSLAQRVSVQVANDYDVYVKYTDPSNATLPFFTRRWPPRWTTALHFTIVPRVRALSYLHYEVNFVPPRVLVTGDGFRPVGGRRLSCVFVDSGYDGLFPPAGALDDVLRDDSLPDRPRYRLAEAELVNSSALWCRPPTEAMAVQLTVAVTPNLRADGEVCTLADPCNHVGPSRASMEIVPVLRAITPVASPAGTPVPITVTGDGFRPNDFQIIELTVQPDQPMASGEFWVLAHDSAAHARVSVNATAGDMEEALLAHLGVRAQVHRTPRGPEGTAAWILWLNASEGFAPSLSVLPGSLNPVPLHTGQVAQLRAGSLTQCAYTRNGRIRMEAPQRVTHAVVDCAIPRLNETETETSVHLTFTAQRALSTPGPQCAFHSYPRIHRIHPVDGTLHGGTEITVHGFGFQNSSRVACRFRNSSDPAVAVTVPASYVDLFSIRCRTPAAYAIQPSLVPHDLRSPTHVIVEVTNNQVHFSSSEQFAGLEPQPLLNRFHYYVVPVLTDLHPFAGPQQGGTMLKVFGKHFSQSAALHCVFDARGDTLATPEEQRSLGQSPMYSRAQWISETLVTCFTPPQWVNATRARRTVDVHVTNNHLRPPDDLRPFDWPAPMYGPGDFSNRLRFTYQADVQLHSVQPVGNATARVQRVRLHSGGGLRAVVHGANIVGDLRRAGAGHQLTDALPAAGITGAAISPSTAGPPCPSHHFGFETHMGFGAMWVEGQRSNCTVHVAMLSPFGEVLRPPVPLQAYWEVAQRTRCPADHHDAANETQHPCSGDPNDAWVIMDQPKGATLHDEVLLSWRECWNASSAMERDCRAVLQRWDERWTPLRAPLAVSEATHTNITHVGVAVAADAVWSTWSNHNGGASTVYARLFRWSPVNYTRPMYTPYEDVGVFELASGVELGAVRSVSLTTSTNSLAVAYLDRRRDGWAICFAVWEAEPVEEVWEPVMRPLDKLHIRRKEYPEKVTLRLVAEGELVPMAQWREGLQAAASLQGFLLVWRDGTTLLLQHVSSFGELLTEVVTVPTASGYSVEDFTVVGTTDGAAVVWAATGHTPTGSALVGQRYEVAPLGGAVRAVGLPWFEHRPEHNVTALEFRADPARSASYHVPVGARTATGGMLLLYLEQETQNSTQARLMAQRFSDVMLKCRIGEKTMYAVLLHERALMCDFPAYRTLNTTLTVATNAIDFSPPNITVEYYGTCEPGQFCPDHEDQQRLLPQAPCPPGHYCPVENSYVPVPCEPGTYQDMPGMTRCKPCPVGHHCPERGMSRPQLCPAGFVCDSVGIRRTTMLCPDGHYCLPGTAHNLTDCCWQEAPGDHESPACQCYFDDLAQPGHWADAEPAAWVATPQPAGTVELVTEGERYIQWAGGSPVPPRGALLLIEGHTYEVDHELPFEGRNVPIRMPYAGATAASVPAFLVIRGSLDKFVERPGRPIRCADEEYCAPGVATNVSIHCTDDTRPDCYHSPQPCQAGYRCAPGSRIPRGTAPCPPGRYKPYALAPNGRRLSAMERCQTHELISAGFLERDCTGGACTLAEYCSMPAGPSSGACMQPARYFCECPRGHYCPGEGNAQPRPCNPRSYNDATGLAACKPCLRGHTCPTQAIVFPPLCRAGFICNEESLDVETELCAEGYYCLPGVRTEATYTVRDTNTSSPLHNYIQLRYDQLPLPHDLSLAKLNEAVGLLEHAIEEFRLIAYAQMLRGEANGTAVVAARTALTTQVAQPLALLQRACIPLPCPQGFYCMAGVSSPIPREGDFSTPQFCVAGTFCKRASLSQSGTQPCPPGFYCPTGSHTPTPAAPGQYALGFGNGAPKACFPGTFAAFSAQPECTPCPKGFVCPGANRNDTVLGAAGTVVAATGRSSTTTRCPAGYYCGEGLVSVCTETTAEENIWPAELLNVSLAVVPGSAIVSVDGWGDAPCDDVACDLREYINRGEPVSILGVRYTVSTSLNVPFSATRLTLDRPFEGSHTANVSVVRLPCDMCTPERTCANKYASGQPQPTVYTQLQRLATQGAASGAATGTVLVSIPGLASVQIAGANRFPNDCPNAWSRMFDGDTAMEPAGTTRCATVRSWSLPLQHGGPVINVSLATPLKLDVVELHGFARDGTGAVLPLPVAALRVHVVGVSTQRLLGHPVGASAHAASFAVQHRAYERVYVNDTHWELHNITKVSRVRVQLRSSVLPASTISVHLTELRLLTRQEQYVPGAIVLALRAKWGQPFPTDCCARPIPCPEGTFCLGGVKSDAVDFTGSNFDFPQWCIEGTYCGLASKTPQGNGLCPAGYYCPPGTARPRPCWKGHYCRGEGNTLPTPCSRGTFSELGLYPPFTLARILGVRVPFIQHVYQPSHGPRRCTAYCCRIACTACVPPAFPGGPMRDCTSDSVTASCMLAEGQLYGCATEQRDLSRLLNFGGGYDWEWFPSYMLPDKPQLWAVEKHPQLHEHTFHVTACPPGHLFDCTGACVGPRHCQLRSQGKVNCSMWLGDGVCDSGSRQADDGTHPNFDCAAFAFDDGDCPASGLSLLEQLAELADVQRCQSPTARCLEYDVPPSWWESLNSTANAAVLQALNVASREWPLDVLMCAAASLFFQQQWVPPRPPAAVSALRQRLDLQRRECGDNNRGALSPGETATWPYAPAERSPFLPFEPDYTLRYDLSNTPKLVHRWEDREGVHQLPWYAAPHPQLRWHFEQAPCTGCVASLTDARMPLVKRALLFPAARASMASLSALTTLGTLDERVYRTGQRSASLFMYVRPAELMRTQVVFETGGQSGGLSVLIADAALHIRLQCHGGAENAAARVSMALRPPALTHMHALVVSVHLRADRIAELKVWWDGRLGGRHAVQQCTAWLPSAPVPDHRSGLGQAGTPTIDVAGWPQLRSDHPDAPFAFSGHIATLLFYEGKVFDTPMARHMFEIAQRRTEPDNIVGAAQCRRCGDGTFCRNERTLFPVPCGPGQYRNATIGGNTCSACPEGVYSPLAGLKAEQECTPCPPGVVCNVPDNTDLTIPRNVAECPQGYFCSLGTQKSTQFRFPCRPGIVCMTGTLPPADFLTAGHWESRPLSSDQDRAFCEDSRRRGVGRNVPFRVLRTLEAACDWRYTGSFAFNATIAGVPLRSVKMAVQRSALDLDGMPRIIPLLEGAAMATDGLLYFVRAVNSAPSMEWIPCGMPADVQAAADQIENGVLVEPVVEWCKQRIVAAGGEAVPRAVAQFTSGPFLPCPAGYECRDATGVSDASRLRYLCPPGFFCPPNTVGPLALACEGLCRRPLPTVTAQLRIRFASANDSVVLVHDSSGLEVAWLVPSTPASDVQQALSRAPTLLEQLQLNEAEIVVRWLAITPPTLLLTVASGPYSALDLATVLRVEAQHSNAGVNATWVRGPEACCEPECVGTSLRARCGAVPAVHPLQCPPGSLSTPGAAGPSHCRVDWSCLAQDQPVYETAQVGERRDEVVVPMGLVGGVCPLQPFDIVYLNGSRVEVRRVDYQDDQTVVTLPQNVSGVAAGALPVTRDGTPQFLVDALGGCFAELAGPTAPPARVRCSNVSEALVPGDSEWLQQARPSVAAAAAERFSVPHQLPHAQLPAHSFARITFNLTGLPAEMEYNNHFRVSIFVHEAGVDMPKLDRAVLPDGFEAQEAGVNYLHMLEFALWAPAPVHVRVALEVLHGKFDRPSFRWFMARTATIHVMGPGRANAGTDDTFAAVIRRDKMLPLTGRGTSMPTNVPLLDYGEPRRRFTGAVLSFMAQPTSMLVGRTDHVVFDDLAQLWRDYDQYQDCLQDYRTCPYQLVSFLATPTGRVGRPHTLTEWRESVQQGANTLYYMPFQKAMPMLGLPFISNCRHFGAYLPLYRLFEDPQLCSIVKEDGAVTPVGVLPSSLGNLGVPFNLTTQPGSAPAAGNLVADRCSYELQCAYDEYSNSPRELSNGYWWQERSEREPLFYLTADPVPLHVAHVEQTYLDAVLANSKQLVPVVSEFPSTRGTDRSTRYVPTEVELHVGYMQVSQVRKRIVNAKLVFRSFRDTAAEPTCPTGDASDYSCELAKRSYTFRVRFTPLTYWQLLNAFALPDRAYAIAFGSIAVCALLGTTLPSVVIMAIRKRFRLDLVPTLRFVVTPLLLASVGLGAAAAAAAVVFYVLIHRLGPLFFDLVPMDISLMIANDVFLLISCDTKAQYGEVVRLDVNCLTDEAIVASRYSRTGFAMVVLACLIMAACITNLVEDLPMRRLQAWLHENRERLSLQGRSKERQAQIKQEIEHKKHELIPYPGAQFNPVVWHRASLKFAVLVEVVVFVFFLELSGLRPVRDQIVAFTVALKLVKWGVEDVAVHVFHEHLLAAPFVLALAVMELVNTLASPTFFSFVAGVLTVTAADVAKRLFDPWFIRLLQSDAEKLEPDEKQRQDGQMRDLLRMAIACMASVLFMFLAALYFVFGDVMPLFNLAGQHVAFAGMMAVCVLWGHVLACGALNALFGRSLGEHLGQIATWASALKLKDAASKEREENSLAREQRNHDVRKRQLEFLLSMDERYRSLAGTGLGIPFFFTVMAFALSILLLVSGSYMLKESAAVDFAWVFVGPLAGTVYLASTLVLGKLAPLVVRALPPEADLGSAAENEQLREALVDAVLSTSSYGEFKRKVIIAAERQMRTLLVLSEAQERELQVQRKLIITRRLKELEDVARHATSSEEKEQAGQQTLVVRQRYEMATRARDANFALEDGEEEVVLVPVAVITEWPAELSYAVVAERSGSRSGSATSSLARRAGSPGWDAEGKQEATGSDPDSYSRFERSGSPRTAGSGDGPVGGHGAGAAAPAPARRRVQWRAHGSNPSWREATSRTRGILHRVASTSRQLDAGEVGREAVDERLEGEVEESAAAAEHAVSHEEDEKAGAVRDTRG